MPYRWNKKAKLTAEQDLGPHTCQTCQNEFSCVTRLVMNKKNKVEQCSCAWYKFYGKKVMYCQSCNQSLPPELQN